MKICVKIRIKISEETKKYPLFKNANLPLKPAFIAGLYGPAVCDLKYGTPVRYCRTIM